MCCYQSKSAYDRLIRKHPPGKPFTLWKRLTHRGNAAIVGGYQYKPGVHHALTNNGKKWRAKRYDRLRPRGIHVFVNRDREALRICVKVDTADLVVTDGDEAVFRKIEITKSQWSDFKRRVKKYNENLVLGGVF